MTTRQSSKIKTIEFKNVWIECICIGIQLYIGEEKPNSGFDEFGKLKLVPYMSIQYTTILVW
jgi:hypothetical protein